MLFKQSHYSMLINRLSSLRVSVPNDTRQASILFDYSFNVWAVKTILKYLATPASTSDGQPTE